MSETNEIMEKPPSEIPLPKPSGEEKLADDSVNESKKDSDISMLEDEEMPTYSSISSSTKPINSAVNCNERMNHVPMEKSRSQSPEPSENQDNEDNESIYVVSSTPDTDRNFDDIDDEEEDDYDSEEMNEDDEDDDDDEDEDDREEFDRERFERESDDFDQDRFERASDDIVLRHNNSSKEYYKERSLSLQDLSTKDDRYIRRRNFPPFQYYVDQPIFKPNVYSAYAPNSKPCIPFERFTPVGSKNKRYIQNAKEQERLPNIQNQSKNRDFKENNIKQSVDEKQIKEYTKNASKKLEEEEEEEEVCENQVSTYVTLERVENVERRESLNEISSEMHTPMEVDHSLLSRENSEKYKKVNGIIEFDEESGITCTPILKEEITIHQTSEQINGTEPSKNVINLRTLSYKEYMGGASQEDEDDDVFVDGGGADMHDEDDDDEGEDSGNNDEGDDGDDVEVKVESNEICLISPEKISHDTSNTSIQITSVRSNYHDLKSDEINNYKDKNHIKMINQATETIKVENSDLKKLQITLTERNTQFESLKIAYQKTLQENLAMKQELDHLNKTLKKYQEYRNRETKSASVQTEEFKNMDLQNVNLNVGKDRSTTSEGSSIHQWSESGFSPSISKAAPDVRKVVDSDGSSAFEKTPKHPPHTLSRTFITSSRILQTLSNITQKKWNASSPLTQEEKNQERQDQTTFSEEPTSSGTPLNSKKRKATEMLGAPPGFEQPFKIPHTSGSVRKKISHDTNETSQMNGLPLQNENCPENRKNGQEGEDEEEENEEGGDKEDTAKKDLGDNLKYYIYQDEENSKGRSFLIQAEETGKIPSKGIVRECGPYLLGNLEVRMTEVNGTINIWGKEVHVDSLEEEFNLSGKSAEAKSSYCWQKTPQTSSLNSSYMSSSINKKSNPQPRFNDSNVSKHSYFFDNSTPKYSLDTSNQSCHRRNSLTSSDDNCTSRPHGLSWSGCKHLMEEQKHVCHSGHTNSDCGRCNCIHSVKNCECHSCNRVQGCTESYRRHSFSGDSNKCPVENQCLNHSSHCLKAENEHVFKHKTGHCQSSFDKGQNCHHFSRQCHLSKESSHSCNAKNIAVHPDCRGNPTSGCCQRRNVSNQNDDADDHFLSTQQSLEQMEIQKKRLSGKKVRTLLMDLLKGCGDCRTPNPGNISKANIAGRNCKPEIIVTPCTPQASYSNQSQSMEKCCDTCSQRTQVTAEIEAQLEFFRIEMERVRSRSDALLDKLNMLKSTDNN